MVKKTIKILGIILSILFLFFGVNLYCSRAIDNDILMDSVEDTKETFGDFSKNDNLKMFELESFRYSILKTYGLVSKKLAVFNNITISPMAYLSDGLVVTGVIVSPRMKGNYPVIIYNRGGNRDAGSISFRMIQKHMAFLADKGYIVVASNYRGNRGSEGKEEFGGADVNDVMNLIPILDEIPSADTSRVGVFGHSRGGIMTYKALQNKGVFKAAVVMAGSTDLFESIKNRPEMEQYVYSEVIPDYSLQKDEKLKDRSAVYWPEKIDRVPLCILHGTSDKRVAYNTATTFTDRLTLLHFPYQFVTFLNDNHILSNHQKESQNIIVNWFNRYLTNQQPFDVGQRMVEIQ